MSAPVDQRFVAQGGRHAQWSAFKVSSTASAAGCQAVAVHSPAPEFMIARVCTRPLASARRNGVRTLPRRTWWSAAMAAAVIASMLQQGPSSRPTGHGARARPLRHARDPGSNPTCVTRLTLGPAGAIVDKASKRHELPSNSDASKYPSKHAQIFSYVRTTPANRDWLCVHQNSKEPVSRECSYDFI